MKHAHRWSSTLSAGLGTPRNLAIWTIRTINPDGAAQGARRNVRDVDLNENPVPVVILRELPCAALG